MLINVFQCVHCTDRIVFASRVLNLTLCNIDVLHAKFLAIVRGGRTRKGQQQHVDDTNVGLTSTGGNPRLVMVPYLITVEAVEDIKRMREGE